MSIRNRGQCLSFPCVTPTPGEIEAAKSGKLEMALYESKPVIFILVKIKGMSLGLFVSDFKEFGTRVFDMAIGALMTLFVSTAYSLVKK